MKSLNGKSVVIIADWLTNQGGAEQVVSAMAELFPESPIYTSVYTPGSIPALDGRDVRGTWLQYLPAFLRRKHQFLLPFLPHAFGRLNLSEFDVIISSSSAFSKNIKKSRADQIHICYCHTPTRYLYNARQEYLDSYPLPWWLKPFKWLLPQLLDWLTKKDLQGAKGVDYFVSNSNYIAARIKKYYGRDATTICPCTDTAEFSAEGDRTDLEAKPFLALGRFIPYKRFDLLVETFAQNGLPLHLGGVGPELDRCKALAAEHHAHNIKFLEFVPYEDLPKVYAGARAFLFPAEEDFGLTPVEAMASGVPIIALGKGGALESVTKNTGLFFEEQTPRSLQKAIDEFISNEQEFSSRVIAEHAENFSVKAFKAQLLSFVESKI